MRNNQKINAIKIVLSQIARSLQKILNIVIVRNYFLKSPKNARIPTQIISK